MHARIMEVKIIQEVAVIALIEQSRQKMENVVQLGYCCSIQGFGWPMC
jgi:hypothetical protein